MSVETFVYLGIGLTVIVGVMGEIARRRRRRQAPKDLGIDTK